VNFALVPDPFFTLIDLGVVVSPLLCVVEFANGSEFEFSRVEGLSLEDSFSSLLSLYYYCNFKLHTSSTEVRLGFLPA
jgi:hypothetical protein